MTQGIVTSAGAAPVRAARALHLAKNRRATGRLLAEGPQAVGAALAVGVVEQLLVGASQQDRRADLVEQARAQGRAVLVLADDLLASLVAAETPQGVVAVCRWAPGELSGWLGGSESGVPDLVVLAHEMADPGNAGALIRVADAVGASAVALSARSVDPTNAKAVRASAGSLFHLPVLAAGPTPDAVAVLRASGMRVLAADVGERSIDLFAAERGGLLAGPVAWVFGNEAHGLPDEILERCDDIVRIPILGHAESLNLATAAAVCLYAVARQRHAAPRV